VPIRRILCRFGSDSGEGGQFSVGGWSAGRRGGSIGNLRSLVWLNGVALSFVGKGIGNLIFQSLIIFFSHTTLFSFLV
jgi:hypothetical protein